jgi:predicted component of type VI protein secretion system
VSKPSLDLFLEACGLRGPLELHVAHLGRQEMAHWVFHQPFAVIGSQPQADIPLNDPDVGRRHLYLQALGGRLFAFDLHTRATTHPPDRPPQDGWVSPSDVLRVGPFRVQAVGNLDDRADSSAAKDPLTGQSGAGEGLPEVQLLFERGPQQYQPWPMTMVLALVGRSPACKVCLEHSTVSKTHCGLVRTPAGLAAVDLCGRGGVRVNGARMPAALLRHGDQLQIGLFAIRISYDRPNELDAWRSRHLPALAANTLLPATVPTGHHLLPSTVSTRTSALSTAGSEVRPLDTMEGPAQEWLVNQFGLLQKQMFEQFQQSLIMAVQMFGALHRKQEKLFRQELEHLCRLTREVLELQTRLAAPAPDLDRTSPEEIPVLDRPEEEVLSQEAPATENGPPQSKQARVEPSQQRQDEVPASTGQEPNVAPAPPAGQSSEEIHAWLSQRLASIQQERQGRWEKLLGMLLRKKPEEPMP